MIIAPYSSVDEVHFGVSEELVRQLLGPAMRTGISRMGHLELHYANVIVRLTNSGVVEVTVNSPMITLRDLTMSFEELTSFVANNDAGAFDTVGFRVSPAFGIAFDPTFPNWVTAFTRNDLPRWKLLPPNPSLERP